MNKNTNTINKSLGFATENSLLSSKHNKQRPNLGKIAQRIAVFALSGATVVAGFNSLEKASENKPSEITTLLPAKDITKLESSSGLPVLTNVTIKASSEQIHFRNSCEFQDSSGDPLNNIVFNLNPNQANSPAEVIHAEVAIPVNGPSADPNISQSDVWLVLPTGEGNQAICVDATEVSRGANFSDVTVSDGENAVLSNPNASATLRNNTIYVYGHPLSKLQYPS
jgi:hypothetical protein